MSNTYDIPKVDEVLGKVNYAALAKQRLALIEIAEFDMTVTEDRRQKLSGLVSLFDGLVDALVADGVPGARKALLSDTIDVEVEVKFTQKMTIEVEDIEADALREELSNGNYDAEILEKLDPNGDLVVRSVVVRNHPGDK